MRNIIENKEIKVNEKNIIPLAEVKEESDVTLNLELYKNNIPFDVTGQSIKLGLLINNELIGEQSDGITINKNVVTIKLKNSFIQPGKLELDLTLTDNTGRMTTSSFYLIVNKKTIGGTSIQGIDLLETLDKIILYFKVNSQKAIDGFVAESTELLSDIKKNGEKTINDIKSNYDSLKQIIIDENQAANLQEQINVNKNRIEQLENSIPVWQEHEGIGHVTINDSFDGIAKDLVIKGQTLQNLVENGNIKKAIMRDGATQAKYMYSVIPDISNKIYTLILVAENVAKEGVNVSISFNRGAGSQGEIKGIKNGINIATNIIRDIVATELMLYYTSEDIGKLCDVKDIILLEGDYTNKPIPSTHFDSITSTGEQEDNKIKIKSTGKNLYDFTKTQKAPWDTTSSIPTEIIENGIRIYRYSGSYRAYYVPMYLKKGTYKSQAKFKSSDGVTRTVDIVVDQYIGTEKISIYRGVYSSTITISNDGLYYIGYLIASSSMPSGAYVDLTDIQIEEGTKATNYEQFRSKSIEMQLPFDDGLKSLPNGISDEIYDNGKIIQKIEKRVYESGDELLPNVITDKKNTIIELDKYKTYDINPFFLRTFNETTHLYQENNICGEVSFKIAKDRNSIINGNTESISKLSEISDSHESFINKQKDKNQLITTDISDIKTTIGELTESDVIQNKKINDITNIINTKLSGIYLDDMEGDTDFEKLQNAIIKIIKGDNRNIILDRKVVIPSSKSLLINREVEGSYLTDNHLGYQINVYGIGNGGIIKKDNGFIFDSTDINNGSDESVITFTGQIALYNVYIEGNKDNAIINGDRLIRFTIQNCDINKIKLVKSIKFTQSLYFLNNRVRWWNDNCIDTNNNYDLTVKNNLFEFGQNFWTFKGANGVRIVDNVIEGLTGYVVKAKPESGCNSLVIDGNYVEGNKEYFDFTELKGNGLKVSNTFSHTTESDTHPVIFYLPIKAYETGSHLDETVFISNSDTGNSWLYDFKSKPSDFVKIICIGDRGNIKTKEYSKYLTFVGRTLSEAGINPNFKKYRKGDIDVIYGNHQETITLSSGTKVHVIEIDTGFILNETDLVSIQYNGGGGNYDDQTYIANVNICSHIIKDNSTKLKVIVSPTGNYLGQVIVNLKISILKTPFTVYF